MKHLNGDKQERSVWNIGICIGSERLKGTDGKKVHSTQKPEMLLEKVILSSSKQGDVVLDPFFGTGTTGAVAKRFGRHFVGIEQDESYAKIAASRIRQVRAVQSDIASGALETKPPRVSLHALVGAGLLRVGERFYDKNKNFICTLLDGGRVGDGAEVLSIHKMAAKHLNKSNHNGWGFFYVERDGGLVGIDALRYEFCGGGGFVGGACGGGDDFAGAAGGDLVGGVASAAGAKTAAKNGAKNGAKNPATPRQIRICADEASLF